METIQQGVQDKGSVGRDKVVIDTSKDRERIWGAFVIGKSVEEISMRKHSGYFFSQRQLSRIYKASVYGGRGDGRVFKG